MALAQRHEVGPVESLGVCLVLEWFDVIHLCCWLMLALLLTSLAPGVMLQEQASES
jgi:hypothetical protein